MERQIGSKAANSFFADDETGPKMPLDMRLAGVDLNLLVSLEALLICQNVTHAARRTRQTQPAMSRALARLREMLGDDLLVRSTTGMKLTALGEHLAQAMPATMSHVREVVSSRQVEEGVRISLNVNLTPALLPHLMQSATKVDRQLKVSTHKSWEDGVAQLRSYSVDYILGAIGKCGSDVKRRAVFTEEFVTLISFERHTLGGVRPTEEAFLELTHINLVENGVEIFPQVAEALIDYGVRQSRMLELPDVTSAALMVSESKVALTVPRSVAGWLTKTLPLSAVLPQIPILPQEVAIGWLAEASDLTRQQMISDIVAATKDAATRDQASIRILRSIALEE